MSTFGESRTTERWDTNLPRPPEDPEELLPTVVPKVKDILQVKCGDSQILFLNTEGQVLVCGMIRCSSDQQYHYPAEGTSCLGITATPVPIQMPGNQKAVRIETGNASIFAAALLEDDSLESHLVRPTLSLSGELARSGDIAAPIPDGEYDLSAALVIMEPPEIEQTFLTPNKARFAGPIPFPYSRKTVLSFACGANHLLVIARNVGEGIATLYSSGRNSSGQLGLPKKVDSVHELTEVRSNVSLVVTGPYHSCLVDGHGHRMFACGQLRAIRSGSFRFLAVQLATSGISETCFADQNRSGRISRSCLQFGQYVVHVGFWLDGSYRA